MGITNEDIEFEADMFALQVDAWILTCSQSKSCPVVQMFRYFIAQRDKIKRLEHELKRIKEFPNEN